MARNPSAIPADTSVEVWRMQMAAIAKRSMAERLAEFEALNRAGNQMEADGIRRANPEFTDRQVFLTMVRRRYGDELARQVWPEIDALELKQADH